MPDIRMVRTMATTYTVTAMPADAPAASSWAIDVQWLGAWEHDRPRPADRQWTVMHFTGLYLDRDGAWERPPVALGASDGGWWARHRFGLDEALRLAQEAAPRVVVGGMTAAEAIEWRTAQRAAEDSAA